MGRDVETAIRLFVASAPPVSIDGEPRDFALECLDDASDTARCADIYRALSADSRIDLIFGPYSTRLARAAAPIAEQAGRVFINHGGAGDELYQRGYRMIVGVLSPASDYMLGFVRLLSQLKLWRKRVAIVAANSAFARDVADGVERAALERFARRHGVRVRVKWNGTFSDSTPAKLFPALIRNRIDALVSCGSYQHDLDVIRAVAPSPLKIMVLGCVAAGVRRFAADLGELADGIVGPSQWEESLDLRPDLGPPPAEFSRLMRAAGIDSPDYPSAQIYAAGLLTVAALRATGSLDQPKLRDAFSDLRTSTFFGDFSIDRVTGRQLGHQMLLVQWHAGRKIVIQPESHAQVGTLEFPSGWRLLLAGLDLIKLSRRDDPEVHDEDPSPHKPVRDELDHH
jgi:branched-chain amino acid transport system substrate-binding protein